MNEWIIKELPNERLNKTDKHPHKTSLTDFTTKAHGTGQDRWRRCTAHPGDRTLGQTEHSVGSTVLSETERHHAVTWFTSWSPSHLAHFLYSRLNPPTMEASTRRLISKYKLALRSYFTFLTTYPQKAVEVFLQWIQDWMPHFGSMNSKWRHNMIFEYSLPCAPGCIYTVWPGSTDGNANFRGNSITGTTAAWFWWSTEGKDQSTSTYFLKTTIQSLA